MLLIKGILRYIHNYKAGTRMEGINNPEITVLVDDDNIVKLELNGVLYHFRSWQAIALSSWLIEAANSVTGDG